MELLRKLTPKNGQRGNRRLFEALLCAFRSPSHLRLTGDSVAIYSSGWSFYNQGMRSVFLSHTVNLFRPRFMCRLGVRWNPRFCADLHYSGNGVLSRRGHGVVTALVWRCHWLRLQVEFLCNNRAVVAIINSGSLLAPLSMHRMRRPGLVPCQFPFRSPFALSMVRDSTGFLPPPTRVSPALVSALLTVDWNRSVNLCRPGVSGLVSPYVCLWKDEVGVVLGLVPGHVSVISRSYIGIST